MGTRTGELRPAAAEGRGAGRDRGVFHAPETGPGAEERREEIFAKSG